MNTNHKYDPEDIESLLMHKQYNELFDDEREFVLQHVKNEEEYNSLRSMLFTLHDQPYQEEWLEPDPSIKKELLKEFAAEKKGGFMVWLNSIFILPEIKWYRRPAYQMAFATAVVLIGGIWFFAVRNEKSIDQIASKDVSIGQKDSSNLIQNGNLFAENLSNERIPPAPKTLAVPEVAIEDLPAVQESRAEDVHIDHVVAEGAVAFDDNNAMAAPATENVVSTDVATKAVTSAKPTKKDVVNNTTKMKVDDVKKESEEEKNEVNQFSLADEAIPQTNNSEVIVAADACCAPTTLSNITLTSTNYNFDSTEGFVTSLTINTNSINGHGMKDLLAVLYTAP